ncbi:hypothetical protein MES5069_360078 [Mesorhizobium escarrei]|uniref:Uncharacterized protein n=1 Tax=Mesorhizobium escarrei TaxID=666018 RepID=A0ABN8K142_9HYPH|nr:hypothetical protein MES5069_360078 [Mesorhizobium escarrei]
MPDWSAGGRGLRAPDRGPVGWSGVAMLVRPADAPNIPDAFQERTFAFLSGTRAKADSDVKVSCRSAIARARRTLPGGEKRLATYFGKGGWGNKAESLALKRKEPAKWQRIRFASGTIRTPRLPPASTPRSFLTAWWVPCTVHPVTTRPAKKATC